MSDMSNIKEEPIYTINLKYSCKDYRNAFEMVPDFIKNNNYKAVLKRITITSCCIIVALVLGLIFSFSYKSSPSFELFFHILNIIIQYLLLIYIILLGLLVYKWNCYKYEKVMYSPIVSKFFIKRISKFYKGRTIKEIRRIIIPCKIEFYDKYLIHTTPSLEDINKCSPEDIVGLPLTSSSNKIEYETLYQKKETNTCISFVPGVFIPKAQIEKESIIKIYDIVGLLKESELIYEIDLKCSYNDYMKAFKISRKHAWFYLAKKSFRKGLSIIYKNRSFREIKKIIIPCRLSFYDTYLIKTVPSDDAARGVAPEKISELALTLSSSKIMYKQMYRTKETKDFISFCHNVFIPKNQINEEDKDKISMIITRVSMLQEAEMLIFSYFYNLLK